MISLQQAIIIEIFLSLILLGMLFWYILWLFSSIKSSYHGAPYVPIRRSQINGLLKFGGLESTDTIIDLGCGDSRVLIEAVEKFGVGRAIGYDLSPWPRLKSNLTIYKRGLRDRVKVFKGDALRADVSNASFVYMYLFPKLVNRLAPKLGRELRSGSKILCVSFKIEDPGSSGLGLIKEEKVGRMVGYLYVRE